MEAHAFAVTRDDAFDGFARQHGREEFHRAGGVPAPRAANATVSVNGEPYGLYATVETVDNKEFLEAWYGDAEGALYEGAYGSDLFVDLVPSFDQDNGDNIDFMDIKALVAALDAITDPADFVAEVDKLIDLDLFAGVGQHGGNFVRRGLMRTQFVPDRLSRTVIRRRDSGLHVVGDPAATLLA